MSDLSIKPLSPALVGEFLRFFDHEHGPAFADNPQWAKCYCHFYGVPRAIDWDSLTAQQNRVAMQSRIEVGEAEGFLAFQGNEAVGWMNAQPRHKLPHCFERLGIAPTPLPCAPYQAAVIVCFVIAPAHRRSGVARRLLADGVAALATRGIKLVDAFPFKAGESKVAADHYHGPLSLFLSEGFSILREDARMTVVRKLLA
ncbi:MAG: GNAT family N-acetyltransferase [Betaproteobacteria bacterium]|nr:MAG: GNAT family N-acetyltransferase [Betaproteobacteria bacterium]